MHVGIVNVFLIPNINQTVANNNEEDMGIINVIEYQLLFQRSAMH